MPTLRNADAITKMREVARTAPDTECTFRQQLSSTIGMHSAADQAVLLAHSMGLQAHKESAGGWFAKNHLIVVDGRVGDVLRWHDQIQSWA